MMTQYPTPHDSCPICDRPHAAHAVIDHLNCFEAQRKRNQAARVVELERKYPETEANRGK